MARSRSSRVVSASMLLWAGIIRRVAVDLRLPQADSSKMSDLMRVEEALRLRCRMHIHLCSIDVCLVA